MIEAMLELLASNDYYGKSEYIDIAKGKYKLSFSIKEKAEQKKRAKAWQ